MSQNEGDRSPPPPRDDWALFLDVDGTLTAHVARADAVVLEDRVRHVLIRLQDRLGGALALVTGRSLAALDALMRPHVPAHAACLHGVQQRPGASVARFPPVASTWVEEAASIADRYPGALVEAHGPCLYLHWRAAPAAADAMTVFARRFATGVPSHRLHIGRHGIEIRPDGMDKGMAIADFMRCAPFAGRVPVFAGDDPADEPGFVAVNALGGISVRVGEERRNSAARFRLRNPQEVLHWLAEEARGADRKGERK
ncbi:trehalose-phosphatase [Pseudoxanthomonas mexicana]|uniref:trehalose-phosphatase n=1 Tax=Pseudoxanthomonas mexicana TaxID=128785 RepID=UPI0028B10384|nr:trehalose-phosphatase [Pseudoxanthomonas mexicana]